MRKIVAIPSSECPIVSQLARINLTVNGSGCDETSQ